MERESGVPTDSLGEKDDNGFDEKYRDDDDIISNKEAILSYPQLAVHSDLLVDFVVLGFVLVDIGGDAASQSHPRRYVTPRILISA